MMMNAQTVETPPTPQNLKVHTVPLVFRSAWLLSDAAPVAIGV